MLHENAANIAEKNGLDMEYRQRRLTRLPANTHGVGSLCVRFTGLMNLINLYGQVLGHSVIDLGERSL